MRLCVQYYCLLVSISLTIATPVIALSAYDDKDEGQPGSVHLAKWRGGTGLWSQPTNWIPIGTPGLDEDPYHILVDGGNAIGSQVILDLDANIARLTVQPGDTLIVDSGRTLTASAIFPQVIITNAGTIRLDAAVSTSTLRIGPGSVCELNSSGQLVLEQEQRAAITAEGTDSVLINVDQLISGEGRLGEGAISIQNRSVIRANRPFRRLTIHPGTGGVQNAGLMFSTQGGVLCLVSGDFDNSGGTIRAESESFVDLSGITLVGGRLETTANGYVRMLERPVAWADLVFDGHAILGPTQLQLAGQITNDGSIDVVGDLAVASGYDAASEIILDGNRGPVTLAGEGTLRLLSCLVRAQIEGSAKLVNDSLHSIIGEGPIGDGALSIDNNGLINATGSVGMVFTLGSTRLLRNRAELRATGVGGLIIATGRLQNEGVVDVRPSSRLLMMPGTVCENNSGGILLGGTWRVTAGHSPTTLSVTGSTISINLGDVALSGSGALFPKLNGLSINGGSLRLFDGQNFVGGSTFNNVGVLEIGSGSSFNSAGVFTQAAQGRYVVHVSANSVGDPAAGRVVAGTAAAINGTLEITVPDDLPLPDGAVLEVIDAPIVNGRFSSIVGPPGAEVAYGPGGIHVILPAQCSQEDDESYDGEMNELIDLLAALGVCANDDSPCPWDFNGDGLVDSGDVTIWIEQFAPCPN